MVSKRISVLFAHYGDDWIRGSEIVLLDLLAQLDKEKVWPVIWCNSTAMEDASRKAGYLTYRDEFRHAFDYNSAAPDLHTWRRMVQKCIALCRQNEIDILHSNSLAPTQWLAMAGAILRRPVIAHLHIDYLRRSRYVLGLHVATRIIGCTKSAVAGPLADGVKSDRVRIIYNGIDFSRLDGLDGNLRAELNIPQHALVIASVGSLIRRKGHDILIDAFHALPPMFAEAHLIIAGTGDEESRLRGQVKELGIERRVHFVGDTKGDTKIYRTADIFALASRNEAIPLALMEAGYFGLPTVATMAGGITEAVVNGRNGLLAAAQDTSSFGQALAKMAGDSAMRRSMGTEARQRVHETFNAARMAREFEQTYVELAAIPESELGWPRVLRNIARPYFNLPAFVLKDRLRRLTTFAEIRVK